MIASVYVCMKYVLVCVSVAGAARRASGALCQQPAVRGREGPETSPPYCHRAQGTCHPNIGLKICVTLT